MPVSRHSFRRVIGDIVHRHNIKPESITPSTNGHDQNTSRSRKKSDRNSLISNDSLSFPDTYHDRLHKSEKELCQSLNYLDQVLTHNKLEILTTIMTSLIENIFEIESVLKGIFNHQAESFRTYLLTHVYSLLADLIGWSDQFLFSHAHLQVNNNDDDDKYRRIAQALMQAVKTCISLVCDTSSMQSEQTRSNSFLSFQSIDDSVPALPPKREKRLINSLTRTVSHRSRSDESPSSSSLSASSNPLKQEQENDQRIQSIVDDINHIVENYTRELDDALRQKTNIRSPSIDHISEHSRSSISSCRHHSIDTLSKTGHVSKLHGSMHRETIKVDYAHPAPTHLVGVEHRALNLVGRTMTPPPLPPKRQRARAYMSLFDRYDQNEASYFLRETCFVAKPEHRFEDLFAQIHEHIDHPEIFSSIDESLRVKQATIKRMNMSNECIKDNVSVDRSVTKSRIQRGFDDGQSYDHETKNDALPVDHRSDLFLENISHLLVFNLSEDPPLRGGSIDALIIRATSSDKKDFLYQEAFLTTYRTFITPSDLLTKLMQRYTFFARMETKKKMARYAFSLLMRVIDEIDNELSESLMKVLSDFVTNLIRHGELQLAKLLRRKSLERFSRSSSTLDQATQDIVLIRNSISSKRATLLDFHSTDISEQLTIVDSELFLKIRLSEILYMSIEKGEDYSPNLAAFTEHFNNISYWVRSRILEQNSQRQRENYFEKFLKILKHLRRLNNFNSYLAILSALDCGPLKRLNWSKNIIESVSEHTGLIDSTGSFKNYREALNGSVGQPCIPYIGLILSDLTFIHIGNSDYLQDNRIVNFWKRWQQFTILHKLRYCRKWEYKFVRNDRILYFFNNFDDYMNEEAQWIQSEKIKPRPKVNPHS